MFKLIVSVLFVATSATAFANQFIVFSCQPTESNGLDIKSLVLEISTEDPEAVMTLNYEGSTKAVVNHMSYEGTGTKYTLSPDSNSDGTLRVSLKKKRLSWSATVTDSNVDTFSILTCKK